MKFVAPILKNQPLQVSNQEPALTAGNMVLGTMLAPPFRWRFNREEIHFPITSANTDYAVSVLDLGFMESQWVLDVEGNYMPVTGALFLPVNGATGRPQHIAPQFDDNAGVITFRVDKKPDKNYEMYVDYQKKAPLMTSAASSWGPVPDEFQYCFNEGFLSMMSLLVNDSRFPVFENYFIARLLGAQDGLTDQERNIFLGNWANLVGTMSRAAGAVNSGVGGRTRQ